MTSLIPVASNIFTALTTQWAGFSIIFSLVAAFTGLLAYTHHSGKMSERAKQEEKERKIANQAAAISNKMAVAEAKKPTTKDALIARLENGDV